MAIYIIVILFAGILILVGADMAREWSRLSKYNQSPLKISTFDKTDSPYHPCVKFFPEKWNGYKYWMAETPFCRLTKPYQDRNECPSIHVSNDGINWSEPEGLKNPLDNFGTDSENSLDFFSDPHLVADGKKMECWYRFTSRHGDKNNYNDVVLLRKTSTNGTDWTEKEIITDLSVGVEKEALSPAIIKENNEYIMWYVDNSKIFVSKITDGHNWTDKEECTLEGREASPWHIDVVKIDGAYWLVCYDMQRQELSLWQSIERNKFTFKTSLLKSCRAIGSFYQCGLYRSTLVKNEDQKYRLYFSADDYDHTYIGLMEGERIDNLEIVSACGKNFCGATRFTKQYIKTRFRTAKFITKHLIRKS